MNGRNTGYADNQARKEIAMQKTTVRMVVTGTLLGVMFAAGCTTPNAGTRGMSQPIGKGVVIGTVSGLVTNAVETTHNVQCWKVETPYAKAGRWELSMQHAAEGTRGAFYLTAWTDTDGDGFPDKEVSRSNLRVGQKVGEWTSWEFTTTSASIFVGNCWENQNTEIVFYLENDAQSPVGYTGLGTINYYSRQFNGIPNGVASPRYTNIRLKYLGK